MLMWEVLAEQQPFFNCKHDYDLAINIVNGIRPQILTGTPLVFKELMEQCWDAEPEKRPDIRTLWEKIEDINKSLHENSDYWKNINIDVSSNIGTEIPFSNSKIYTFQDVPKPKNA